MQKRRKKNLVSCQLKELQKLEPKLDSEVLKIFDLSHSVNSKKSFGGTSFDNIKKMLKRYKREIKMKKIIIFLLLLLFVISCGKKSDPEYKAE